MLVQAILIGLIAMFVTFEWMFGTNLGSRPIITGMLVGLVMGDLKTGIILGATLEMVFIGSITLGAAVPPDVITGGILGAAFAISTGKGADVALALAFPIATLYLVVDNVLTLGILPFFLHKADNYIEKGDFKGMERMHILGGFVVKSLPRGIICAVAFYLGTPVMNRVLEAIPEFVQNGLVAAAGFIPALGIALLAQMTSNTAEQKNVIGKKELRSIFLRSLSLEYSWNYERQQNMGYCFAMLPAIKKIYQKKEDQIAAAKRHMEFFNTTPYISTAVFGISTAMEESNARNEDFDTSSINNVKVVLMGPLAGIGDSMFWGTLRVIATGIGTSLAMQGSILGPLLFWLIFNVPAFAVRYICLKFGYKFGTSFLNKIEESGMMPKLTFGAAVLGLMVIGAMIPSMITVNIAGAIGSGDAAVKVQEILDGIMPNLVPFAMTLGIYGLLQKKVKVSWILIVLMVVGIVGALLGIF